MKHTLAFLSLLSFSLLANANDSAAIRLGGGLAFKKTHDIAMLSEDLVISAKKVRVAYTFRNESNKDIEEIIAFPIQEEVWEEVNLNEFVQQINFKLNSNYPVSAVEHEVSLSKEHIVNVLFHWRQKFPAGKVVTVSHEYQPAGGFITPKSATEWSDNAWQSVVNNYCIEPPLNAWIFQQAGWTNEVHYVLTTGANWKAPIGHFKLSIEKETPAQKISLCADNIKKINDTTFQIEQDNFVPSRNVRVLFINPKP